MNSPAKETPSTIPLRKRVSFFIVTVCFPFALLALLEAGLRLGRYGQDLSLFATETIAGKTYQIMNPDVKGRYFGRLDLSPTTAPDNFLVPKPPGVFRIFCLGGSTTVGFPYGPVGSFATFLRDRLHAYFPGKQFDVINLGMTATNSYAVLDIAREIVDYEPDLIIVYDGHNEFYGVLGIASHVTLGQSRWLTELYLALIRFKTVLLVRNVASELSDVFGRKPGGEHTSGTLMEQLARGQLIPYRSPTYDRALRIFRENLAALTDLCRSHGIPIILSTQASNVRDFAPFDSEFQPGVADSLKRVFSDLMADGTHAGSVGSFQEALPLFERALQIDTMRADAHFATAFCLDRLGQLSAARREYLKARDYDQIRFRASTDFNDAIRSACDGRSIFCADIEGAFAAESPDSIIGHSLVLEHLHPNVRGAFLLGRAYAGVMRDHLIGGGAEAWQRADSVREEDLWNSRVIPLSDELAAARRIETLTSRWPFREKLPAPADARSVGYRSVQDQYLAGEISWEQFHVGVAEYCEAHGDPQTEEREYRALMNQIPLNISSSLRLGQLYIRLGRMSEAETILRQTIVIEPSYYGYRLLADIDLAAHNTGTAVTNLEKAFALGETIDDKLQTGFDLAQAYHAAGSDLQSVSVLDQLLQIDPRFANARDLLGRIQKGQR
ncbi:MAG TPA: tetratricopeptide repeat protein [Bacteroidota bacterium]|nr:tetratricopeptide repeat protein [Bacteroidota bacterium]